MAKKKKDPEYIQSRRTTPSSQKMGKKKKSKTVSEYLITPAYNNKPNVSYSKTITKTKGNKTRKKSKFKQVSEKNGEFTKYVSRTRNGNKRVRTKKISAKRAAGIARRLKKKY
jgi:DNA-directed RNA polymerase subunit M/transcription elongation factor TFIIS